MEIAQSWLAMIAAWYVVALPALLLALLLWATRRGDRPLLPPNRCPRHRIDSLKLAACVLVYLFGTALVGAIVSRASDLGLELSTDANLRRQWGQLIAVPLILLAWWGILRMGGANRCYQIGLHGFRWREALIAASLAHLVATPVIYHVNLASVIVTTYLGMPPEPHPLTELVTGERDAVRLATLIAAGTVAAPFLEEIFFRGLLQAWTLAEGPRSLLVVGLATFQLLGTHADQPLALPFTVIAVLVYAVCPIYLKRRAVLPPADPSDETAFRPTSDTVRIVRSPPPFDWESLERQGQALFPGLWAALDPLSRRQEVHRFRAVFAVALLFASIHLWPGVIALLLFGVVAGFLALRTRSLVGPIGFHVLFNAAACAEVILFAS